MARVQQLKGKVCKEDEQPVESIRKTRQKEQGEIWPALPFEAWRDTRETLHLWTQIVGKVRMELSPPVNHRILAQTETVLQRYRSHFLGKSSPVHFFWGSFDLALTVFSGRRAPERQGTDR